MSAQLWEAVALTPHLLSAATPLPLHLVTSPDLAIPEVPAPIRPGGKPFWAVGGSVGGSGALPDTAPPPGSCRLTQDPRPGLRVGWPLPFWEKGED